MLATLPRREFRAGLYEVIKYGVIAANRCSIAGHARSALCGRKRGDVLAEVVADWCRIKAEIVSADERESGLRRVLNFGHTPDTRSRR